MKIVALICNVVLFGFICFVLVTEGAPRGASYIVFTLWSLLTLILSSVVISRSGASDGWPGLRIVAIICNIVFFGFVCWAFVDQYPHPEEDGVVAFTVLMVLTPILSLVVLFRSGASGWLGSHMKRKGLEERGRLTT